LNHRRLVTSAGFGLLFVVLFSMSGVGVIQGLLAFPPRAVIACFLFLVITSAFFLGFRGAARLAGGRWYKVLLSVFGLLVGTVVLVMAGKTANAKGLDWIPTADKLIAIALIAIVALSARNPGGWARKHEHRAAYVVFLLLIFALPGVIPSLGFEFFPQSDQGQINVTVEMPIGSSLEATNAAVNRVEDIALKVPEAENVFTSVGSAGGGHMASGSSGPNYGSVTISLQQKESVIDRFLRPIMRGKKRVRKDTMIAQEIRQQLAGIPGGRIMVVTSSGMGGGWSPVDIELTGTDTDELNAVAQKIKGIVASTEGTLNPDVSWKVGKPEIKATIDRDRAADMGFSVGQIAQALRTSVEGSTDTHFRENGKEYDIRVRLNQFDRYSLSDVGRVVIGSVEGSSVFLQDVAKITEDTGPTKIERKNRQRKVSITASLLPGYPLGNVQQVLNKKLEGVPMGNVSLNWGGQAEMMKESFGYMIGALFLAIALVFMLMAALFESLLSPLIIMFSLPMALIGAIIALVITGETMSLVAMIGFIMLMGLVTKNAILLVDYTNTLRSRGKERTEAILEAGPTRLRPILMTTFAMIFGMLPTALKLGRGSETRAPMAIAVIGGLIVSTILTLVIIPVVYTLVDDVMVKYQARKQRLLGKRERWE